MNEKKVEGEVRAEIAYFLWSKLICGGQGIPEILGGSRKGQGFNEKGGRHYS